ncbi:S-layer homology domain-containing protein [Lysinibacillus telephonicus]|uniref:S-layer homology domain-containing protein n=1 Tax=Lysinibacillus telephonicus TaxID=1714840 RepID=A0A431UKV0_9BACI|nr:S-layer homology domain-containing protein [Lysinibacillus telephonicus]RTQ90298.1 S-layer homology domain-containing protein [Lysinibacillus telephonicus]
MKKIICSVALGLSLLVALHSAEASVHYKDVKPTDNFYPAVESMIEQGAISSTLPYFNPNEKVTRGQAAKMIAIAAGLDYENVSQFDNFKDVPKTHQFYPYIDEMHSKGIISGYNYYEFGVNDYLTRGQMAKILVNAFNVPLLAIESHEDPTPQFKDIFTYNYGDILFKQHGLEIMSLKYFNLLSGLSENEYGINKHVTRSQLVLLIDKLQKNKESYSNIRKLTLSQYFENYISTAAPIIIEDTSIVKVIAYIPNNISIRYRPSSPQKLQFALLKPLKEGTTTITSNNGEKISVTVYKKDGVLRTSFEKLPQ